MVVEFMVGIIVEGWYEGIIVYESIIFYYL